MSNCRAVDLLPLLRQQLVLLTGGRDRRGGPLLVFPASRTTGTNTTAGSSTELCGPSELSQLLHYLWRIPDEKARTLGFTVIVDTRCSDSGWRDRVKPLLKVLRDDQQLSSCVHVTFVVRAERSGWPHKSSSSSSSSAAAANSVMSTLSGSKCRFDTCVVSAEQLLRAVEREQLPAMLGGSQMYDHQVWLEVRLAWEQFGRQTADALARLDDLREQLAHDNTPPPPHVTSVGGGGPPVGDGGHASGVGVGGDVADTKRAIDRHVQLRAKVYRNAWAELDSVGRRLLVRLGATNTRGPSAPGATSSNSSDTDSGYAGSGTGERSPSATALMMIANADMQACVPAIVHTLDTLQSSQRRLQQLWQFRRTQLDQTLQLRVLEKEVDETLQTVRLKRDQFLHSYVDVGRCYRDSKQLQEHHSHFSLSSMNVYVQLNRLLSDATRMIDARHCASARVRQLASCMERSWKQLAAGLDERTTVLALAVMFHQRAEQYVQRVPEWLRACQLPPTANTITAAVASPAVTTSDDGGSSSRSPGDLVSKPNGGADSTPTTTTPSGGGIVEQIEAEIHTHHQLYECMCQAYTEVHSTSKKLLYQLDHMVQVCCQLRADAATSSSASSAATAATPAKSSALAADYSGGASHVLAIIRQILSHHRTVEQQWQRRKDALHQRLALQLFEEDVRQVLDWLDTHGDMFLRKNTALGRNLERAVGHLRSHEHFVAVAQNTYTNAEKLLAAADELARSGDCVASQVYQVAGRLSERIAAFVSRVERRRRLLQLAVTFYTHQQQVAVWHAELRSDLSDTTTAVVGNSAGVGVGGGSAGDGGNGDACNDSGPAGSGSTTSGSEPRVLVDASVQGCRHLLEELAQRREPFIEAVSSTLAEGEVLLTELASQGVTAECDAGGSVAAVRAAQHELRQRQESAAALWGTRQVRLDLSLRLRVFERNVMQVASAQIQQWADEYRRHDTADAERLLAQHNTTVDHVLSVLYRLQQEGRQVSQLLQQSGIHFMTDSSTTAGERCDMLLDYISERQSELDELAERRRRLLEQSVQLGQLQAEANQVTTWIRNGEAMLAASFNVPSSLHEAEQFKLEHEQLQRAVERTHTSAVLAWRRAETLINTNHYQPDAIRTIAENITRRWQQLVTCAEDRHKLVTSSLSFFKTASEVCVVLEGLEREYCRDDDWCALAQSQRTTDGCLNAGAGGAAASADADVNARLAALDTLIEKHQEQKVVFLKACTHARRGGGSFLKYATRSVQYYRQSGHRLAGGGGGSASADDTVRHMLDRLLTLEGRVMQCWNVKKRRLDWCHQYTLVERSARQALEWIGEKGDRYLRTHTSVGESRAETQRLLSEHATFRATAKETRERVKLLTQLADNLVEKGHSHAGQIGQWVSTVDATYREFARRMDEYRSQLECRLGVHSGDSIVQQPQQQQIGQLSSSSAGVASETSSLSSTCSLTGGSGGARDRLSDTSLEARVKEMSIGVDAAAATSGAVSVGSSGTGVESASSQMVDNQLSEVRRKAARRRDFIMTELLDTERAYVKDLQICVGTYLSEAQNSQHAPASIRDNIDTLFGNIVELLDFHCNTFLRQLQQYTSNPEDVGHCFVTWCHQFDMYVHYCRNKPDSNALLVQCGSPFFEQVQQRHGVEHSIAAYLIKPVQRITKYQLLLKDLLSCCDGSGEIRDGLDVMLGVPKKANDAMHLSMLSCCDVDVDSLGEVLLQDSFQAIDTKSLLRKGRDRRLFLFDFYLVFSKEVKDSDGKQRYIYKHKLLTADIGVTEHVEGDECKFAVWTGRPALNDFKITLKAVSLDVKQQWVKRLRELKQETCFRASMPLPISSATGSGQHRALTSSSTSSLSSSSASLPSASRSPADQRSTTSLPNGPTEPQQHTRVLAGVGRHLNSAGDSPGVQRKPPMSAATAGGLTVGAVGGRRWLPPPLRKLSSHPKLIAVAPPIAVGIASGGLSARNATLPSSDTIGSGTAYDSGGVETDRIYDQSEHSTGNDSAATVSQSIAITVAGGSSSSDAGDEPVLPPPMCVLEASSVTVSSTGNTVGKPTADPSAPSTLVDTDSSSANTPTNEPTSAICNTTASSPSDGPFRLADQLAALRRQLDESERQYISQLRHITGGYMAAMVSVSVGSGEAGVLTPAQRAAVLSNIEALCVWHDTVMSAQLHTVCDGSNNGDICRQTAELSGLFQRHRSRLLAMYSRYCHSWLRAHQLLVAPSVDSYCKQLQAAASTTGCISSSPPPLIELLQLPLHRPAQYHRILDAISRQLLEAGNETEAEAARQLQPAVLATAELVACCSDTLEASRLTNVPGGTSPAVVGRVLRRGHLLCRPRPQSQSQQHEDSCDESWRSLVVFVFERALVLGEVSCDASNANAVGSNGGYSCTAHIPASRLQLAESTDSAEAGCEFSVGCHGDSDSDSSWWQCRAETATNATAWFRTISAVQLGNVESLSPASLLTESS